MAAPKPWERQPRESDEAFEAFTIYRDMKRPDSRVDRSIREVSEILKKSGALIGRWSSQHKWVERVAAWDNEKDRIAREEQLKQIKIMRKKHAQGAAALFTKAMQGLRQLDAGDLNAQDVVRLFAEAVRTERLSNGDSETVVEERDGGQAIPAVQFYIPENGRDKADDGDLEEEV